MDAGYGETVSGREQLAILKYAEALEVIPRTLIENAGLDTINLIADLKAAHEENKFIGINVFDGKVVDMKEAGVIEPLRVKIQALQSAGEATEMILRIDLLNTIRIRYSSDLLFGVLQDNPCVLSSEVRISMFFQ